MDGSNKHKEDEEACLYSWRWLATSKLGPRVGFGHGHCHLHLFSSFVEERRQSRVDMWRWDVKNEWGAHVSWRGSFYIFCFAVMNDAGYISTSFHSCSYQLRHDHLKGNWRNATCTTWQHGTTFEYLCIHLWMYKDPQTFPGVNNQHRRTLRNVSSNLSQLRVSRAWGTVLLLGICWCLTNILSQMIQKKTCRKQSPRSQLHFPNVPGWLAGLYGLLEVMRYTASYYQPK